MERNRFSKRGEKRDNFMLKNYRRSGNSFVTGRGEERAAGLTRPLIFRINASPPNRAVSGARLSLTIRRKELIIKSGFQSPHF